MYDSRPGGKYRINLKAGSDNIPSARAVRIVFGIVVLRLARNCLDWYQLLELASTFGVLIGDEDAVYDPFDFNDRLLLGLKGTISEVELQQIKQRMERGRIHKAQRGELERLPPVGYERTPTLPLAMTPNQEVRDMLHQVFRLFRHLGSIRGTLLELRRRGLQLPGYVSEPGLGRTITWRKPSYDAIYHLITNPVYAGIYVYGMRKSRYNPLSRKRTFYQPDRSAWDIVIEHHHEGYITPSEYEENLATLANNRYGKTMSQGAARQGEALLQGIVFCAKCGLKMRPRYTSHSCYYYCDRDHRRFGEPICGRASAKRVDHRLEALLLAVLNEGTVDLSFQLFNHQKEERTVQAKQLRQQVTRLEYEANLARRRYESVDPENRLVAATLEMEWNEKLRQLESARHACETHLSHIMTDPLSVAEVNQKLADLPALWKSGQLSMSDKKEIVRCVIDRVMLNTAGKTIEITVVWQGNTLTTLSIPKYLFTDTLIYEKVIALAREKTDQEIASAFNEEGLKTVKGKPWTERRVMDFRLSNGIPSTFTTASRWRIPDSGYLTTSELASALKDQVGTIQKWVKIGLLDVLHDGSQSTLVDTV
jgi:DNA invertase Pin-like site-specific DNA recombinase